MNQKVKCKDCKSQMVKGSRGTSKAIVYDFDNYKIKFFHYRCKSCTTKKGKPKSNALHLNPNNWNYT